MTHTRRVFFKQSLAGTSVLTALAIGGCAHTPATVLETEPQAAALGYSPNGAKTDIKKYPNYVAGRNCSGCVLFQGKTSDSTGGCAVFANRPVAAKGWCSAWTQKA